MIVHPNTLRWSGEIVKASKLKRKEVRGTSSGIQRNNMSTIDTLESKEDVEVQGKPIRCTNVNDSDGLRALAFKNRVHLRRFAGINLDIHKECRADPNEYENSLSFTPQSSVILA
ncbi:hypothetical protein PanWU01x14_091440 [Parasponia andersonii]|uniref:Uncharacterized protein n=1 Tax=Parasponia andersonii TaxID=3476 RepID=A0A2P5D739_PARAD|nr:hypothetical protein PanWU01x14_091440 [Parasponia andersonii]